MALYNGHPFPKPPEGWDKEKHPHAFIGGVEAFGFYFFAVQSAAPYVYKRDDDGITRTGSYDEPISVQFYEIQNNAWVLTEENDQHANGYPCVGALWANTDILWDDGETVYLAGSDPVLRYLNLRDWVTGLVENIAGLPYPFAGLKQPTSYSYNGVILPEESGGEY